MFSYLLQARELMKISSHPLRLEELDRIENEHGRDAFKELVFIVPGYSIPALMIPRLEFNEEIWLELFLKGYYGKSNNTDWPDHDVHKVGVDPRMMDTSKYFRNLLAGVHDRKFIEKLDKIRSQDSKLAYPKNLSTAASFEANVAIRRRLTDLKNSVDFIMVDS